MQLELNTSSWCHTHLLVQYIILQWIHTSPWQIHVAFSSYLWIHLHDTYIFVTPISWSNISFYHEYISTMSHLSPVPRYHSTMNIYACHIYLLVQYIILPWIHLPDVTPISWSSISFYHEYISLMSDLSPVSTYNSTMNISPWCWCQTYFLVQYIILPWIYLHDITSISWSNISFYH